MIVLAILVVGPTRNRMLLIVLCSPSSPWTTKEDRRLRCHVLRVRSMEKLAWDGMRWGREVLFPANPDLADILGDMDFDFDNLAAL